MQWWLQMLHYLLSYVKLMLSIRWVLLHNCIIIYNSTISEILQSPDTSYHNGNEFVYMIIANMVIKEIELHKQIFQAI